MRDQYERYGAYSRNGREIADRIVGQLLVIHGGDRMSRSREYERVADGRRFGEEIGREYARGAGAVVNTERLAEFFREPLREHTPRNVGPTGRIADKEPHGTGGIGLRARREA